VRHRYEAPVVTTQEYQAFMDCLQDGMEDNYDPTPDRDAIFGPDWRDIEARQTGGLGRASSADTIDAQRVRVPGFTLTFNQVGRLFDLLGHKDWSMGMQDLPDAEECKQIGKDLADLISRT
jgi:hypothetical protein